jgi:hypothetical protein
MANVDTAMGYLWIVTPSDTRVDQLDTGRDWLRLNLAATAAGVGFQPLSQICKSTRSRPHMAHDAEGAVVGFGLPRRSM